MIKTLREGDEYTVHLPGEFDLVNCWTLKLQLSAYIMKFAIGKRHMLREKGSRYASKLDV